MGGRTISVVLAVLSLSFVFSALGATQSYIVYLGGQHNENLPYGQVANTHYGILGSIVGSKRAAREAIFYSYTRCINGFAAILEEEHAVSLSKHPQVLSIFVNKVGSLQTTHSWGFLGLEKGAGKSENEEIPEQSLWKKGKFGKNVIIAHLDTGAWPESASFSDKGFGPVPTRWKGICQNGTKFTSRQCNRKLIGARYFIKGFEAVYGHVNLSISGEYRSPRDKEGHGTHTLSTAGGNFVRNASLYGHAQGVAKGGAPHARVATYKACWPGVFGYACTAADMLAAFDQGIHDGVDVFSISVVFSPDPDYFEDAIAIGAFHAVQRGKIVVSAGGNFGPEAGSVANVAPWIITVAASTVDREFPSIATLGSNTTYTGQSLSQFQLPKNRLYPLVSSVNVRAPNTTEIAGERCFLGALDPRKVKGKIVACLSGSNDNIEKGEAVRAAGGVGMILCNGKQTPQDVDLDIHVLPATHLNATAGTVVFQYIKSTRHPVASIYSRTQLNIKPAPVMADFSSQGPNPISPDILKPDITAPGVNILAAFSEAAPITDLTSDNRHVPFNIISGTSMATPHVAGVAALLKQLQPHWSPGSIKSALMTTAKITDNTKGRIKDSSLQTGGPFNYGAGHVNPNGAADPGLVYDLSTRDYNSFLCSLNYNSTQIKAITGKVFACPAGEPKIYDLNYPSISVSDLKGSVTVKRTVTNVGNGPAIYRAKVQSPDGISVSVQPQVLQFSRSGEKKSFNVALRAVKSSAGEYVFGSITWVNRQHLVASPIAVNATSVKTS